MNEVEETRRYFDRTASDFSVKYRADGSFEERRRVWERCIVDSAGCLDAGRVCLDIGCGDGSLSRPVAARGHRTIGIDQSTSMLSLARQQAAAEGVSAHAEYVEGTIPLPSAMLAEWKGKAGLILCSSVLEYVEDYAAALRQFQVLLTDGGRMIVSVPNRHSVYRLVERVMRRLLPRRDSYLRYQRHQFCADAFKAQLAALGLTLVHEEYFALPLHAFTARLFGGRRDKRVATLYVVVAEKPADGRTGTTFVPSAMTA